MHFTVIWTLQIWEFPPAMVGDTLENKFLPVYRIIKGFILEVNEGFIGRVKFIFPLVDPGLGF